jgi:hypothetical protein
LIADGRGDLSAVAECTEAMHGGRQPAVRLSWPRVALVSTVTSGSLSTPSSPEIGCRSPTSTRPTHWTGANEANMLTEAPRLRADVETMYARPTPPRTINGRFRIRSRIDANSRLSRPTTSRSERAISCRTGRSFIRRFQARVAPPLRRTRAVFRSLVLGARTMQIIVRDHTNNIDQALTRAEEELQREA